MCMKTHKTMTLNEDPGCGRLLAQKELRIASETFKCPSNSRDMCGRILFVAISGRMLQGTTSFRAFNDFNEF